jgi:hypothetical protein
MPLWTPARISTSLWIDFSDSNSITNSSGISQASDKSGNGRHLLQATPGNRPAYTLTQQNGLNVATFDGSSDSMSLAADLSLGTAHSIFVACKNAATINTVLPYQCLISGGSYTHPSTTTSELLLGAGSVTGTLTNERLSSLVLAHDAFGAQVYGRGKTDANIPSGFITSTAYTTSANTFRGRFQGADDLATSSSAGSFSSTNTRFPTILRTVGSRGGTVNFWSGEIWEVLVVPRYLSLEETEMIEGYLAWKWGLQGNLPVSHPYKNAAPDMPIDMGGEIGWWCPSLDDAGNGTANLIDLSESNNRGTLTNMDPATDWVADTANSGLRALDFDGVNDRVVCTSTTTGNLGTSNATICLWARLDNSSRYANLICKRQNSGVFQQWAVTQGHVNTSGTGIASKKIGIFWYRGGAINDITNTQCFHTTDDFADGNWHHICITRTNGTVPKIYIDGIDRSLTTIVNGTANINGDGTEPIIIGSTQDAAHTFGRLDDIRVFGRALTQTEITALASQRGYNLPSNTRRRRYTGGYGL